MEYFFFKLWFVLKILEDLNWLIMYIRFIIKVGKKNEGGQEDKARGEGCFFLWGMRFRISLDS